MSSPVQTSFDLPELRDAGFSVKSDAFAQAVLGEKVKPTYKRAFEGLMSKLTPLDIDELIKNDRPLLVRLSEKEYKSMFPRDDKVAEIFEGAAEYYTEFSHIKIYPDGDTSNRAKLINVVDTAEILEDGSIQFLFTRGIMPHLNDMKSHLLVMSISDFAKLSAKYSQHLFNIFSNWLGKDIVSTRVGVDDLRVLLSVPDSYNTSRFMKSILDVSIKEIVDKTSLYVEYTPVKGNLGKAYKWLDFTVYKKSAMEQESDNSEQMDLIEELAINQFQAYGVSDEQFYDILQARKKENKPVSQQGMNAFFKIMINISERPDTLDFDEILLKVISAGWVKNLEKEWFIDKTRSVKTNPVPGQALPQSKEEKSPPSLQEVKENLAPMSPEEVFKAAYSGFRKFNK